MATANRGNTRTGPTRNVRGRRKGQLPRMDHLLIPWRMLVGLRLMYRGRSTAQIDTVTLRSNSRPLQTFRPPKGAHTSSARTVERRYAQAGARTLIPPRW
jgi:hypothetical protein